MAPSVKWVQHTKTSLQCTYLCECGNDYFGPNCFLILRLSIKMSKGAEVRISGEEQDFEDRDLAFQGRSLVFRKQSASVC